MDQIRDHPRFHAKLSEAKRRLGLAEATADA
jgi:hypothetical protein